MKEPRYQALAGLLRSRIADGLYPVGGLLPAETELCEEFQVSRFTVREALRQLAEEGLLLRRQGSGTVVLAREAARPYRQSLASLHDVLQYAADTELTLGEAEPIDPAALAYGLLAGARGPWVRYRGIRRAPRGGPAICVSDLYIDAAFRGIERQFNRGAGAIYRLIENTYGLRVEEVEQEMSAVSLSEAVAHRLGATTGAPALRIQRRYFGADGRLLEASVSDHPADRFAYAMRLRQVG